MNDCAFWIYIIAGWHREAVTETFYEQELQETQQQVFILERALKKKCNNFYVKWKGYDSSYNISIGKSE